MDYAIEKFLADFKSILKEEIRVSYKKERTTEEGVLYSVVLRPFYGFRIKSFGNKEGYLATPELRKVVRRVGSSFKKASKLNKEVDLDPDGFLLKPSSKRFKGVSYYTVGSTYLHMVFVYFK